MSTRFADARARSLGMMRAHAALTTPAKPVVPMQPTLVGESPDKHGKSAYQTSGGRRLLKITGKELPWVDIHGAEPSRWSKRVARERARLWLTLPESRKAGVLILLGRRVCDAFRLPDDLEWLGWYVTAEHKHTMIAFPHPSYLNRWWNESDNAAAATGLLAAVAGGELPHFDYTKKDE